MNDLLKKSVLLAALVSVGGLALTGCGQSSSGASTQSKPPIIVGSKSFTENILIGDMMYDLLKAKLPGANVENKQNLGGTMVPWNALLSGQIDMYTEYTGTGLIDILKQPVSHDPDYTYQYVSKQYPAKFHVDWMKPIGFNDTYAIAIPKSIADKYNIQSISDLKKVEGQLVFAAEPEFFSRPDGFSGLTKTYGLKFKSTKELNVGLKYEAVAKGDVQVIDVFSTDGDLIKYNMVALKDDMSFYPPYFAAPIVREDIIKAYPQIPSILNALSNQITDQQMQQMNYDVDVQHQSADKVAHDFLVKAGLLTN